MQGAATSGYLCTSPAIKTGEYYADCNLAPSTADSHDAGLGARLWELSEKLAAAAGSKSLYDTAPATASGVQQ